MMNVRMRSFALALAALAATALPLAAQRPAPMQPGLLRVCADPDNLPASNQAGEGLENRLAEFMAKEWNSRLEYVWWAAPRGMMRMLNGRYCDVVLQMPVLSDMANLTKPYFRTSYVIVQRKDVPYRISGLDDPDLKRLKIGVHLFANDGENSPPAMALSRHGVVGNLVGFSTVYVGGMARPEDIVKAVADGTVDVAMVWGPIAGFYARKLGLDLLLTPVPDDTLTGIPFVYSMGMATRRGEPAFRDSLQRFLDTHQPELQRILDEFGVPTVPLPADSAAAGRGGAAH
jgi:mxaJ protein